jgi:photosystem II stability/assembly factor-like uncharacterized protein
MRRLQAQPRPWPRRDELVHGGGAEGRPSITRVRACARGGVRSLAGRGLSRTRPQPVVTARGGGYRLDPSVMLHTLRSVRRPVIATVAVAALALVATGVASSRRSSDDLGCLNGLGRQVGRSSEITSVVVTPSARVYVSTANGRLYTQSGSTWRKVTARLPGTVATSVGERILYARRSGVFLSRDAGRTWDRLTCDLLVGDIAVSAMAPRTIYAGASAPEDTSRGDSGGLYRSTDDGRSWTRTTRFPRMDPRQPSVNVLAVDPTRPRRVYVGLEFGGVQVSTDDGEHWSFQQIHREHPGLYGPQLTAISFGPRRVVWAGSRLQGVFRGTAGGKHWAARGLRGTWVYDVVADRSLDHVALAVTDRGLLRTSSAGERWQRVAGGPRTSLFRVRAREGGLRRSWPLNVDPPNRE